MQRGKMQLSTKRLASCTSEVQQSAWRKKYCIVFSGSTPLQSGPTKCKDASAVPQYCNIAFDFPSVCMYTKNRFLPPWWPGSKPVSLYGKKLNIAAGIWSFNENLLNRVLEPTVILCLETFICLFAFYLPLCKAEASNNCHLTSVDILRPQLPRSGSTHHSKPWHPVPMQGKCCWKQKSLGAPRWWMRHWCRGELFQWHFLVVLLGFKYFALSHTPILLNRTDTWYLRYPRNPKPHHTPLKRRPCSSCFCVFGPRWRSWISCTKWSSSKSSFF